jgi:sugar phosphate isomerase/epimerase
MGKLDIGVLVGLVAEPERELRRVAEFGLASCQVVTWDPDLYEDPVGEALTAAAAAHGLSISTLWAGYPGPKVWNFTEGPRTVGLIPPEYREVRVAALQKAARFAARHGLGSITTHVGFIPEDPNDPLYAGTVEALRQVVEVCREVDVEFRFETGQETPVTLLRTIERLGEDHLGVNLDTANLILYGKANPLDALDVFGRYVRDTHIKDGFYPTDGDNLGRQVPVGEGKVDFPAVIARLKELGYTGPLTIEREIRGAEQDRDIRAAVEYLRPLC